MVILIQKHLEVYGNITKLLILYNSKVHQQLKSGFKRTINWNKYKSKTSAETQNQYSVFYNPSFYCLLKMKIVEFYYITFRILYSKKEQIKTLQKLSRVKEMIR